MLIVVVSAGYAAWRGFMSETLTIFAWAAAAFACLYFGPYLVPLTRGMVASPGWPRCWPMPSVFLAVFIPLVLHQPPLLAKA